LAIEQLKWLSDQLPDVTFKFDLADARGYAYYSGLRFAIYAKGASDAVVRGGRYDGVGAAFGHEMGSGFQLRSEAMGGGGPATQS
jgi:ATP phosphoribosyltransferase regulatory subunit